MGIPARELQTSVLRYCSPQHRQDCKRRLSWWLASGRLGNIKQGFRVLSVFDGAGSVTSRPRSKWSYRASVVISAACGASAYRRVLAPFIKRLVGGSRLCWFASLCGGRPLVHVLSIFRPTGCYALILIHPFLLSVVAIPLSSSFLPISAKIRSGRRSCTLRNYLL